jgi:hypothetical protein
MKILTINTKHHRFQTQGLTLEEAIHEVAANQERGNKQLIEIEVEERNSVVKRLTFKGPIIGKNNAYLAVLYLLSFRPDVEIYLFMGPSIVIKLEDEAAIVSFLLDYP